MAVKKKASPEGWQINTGSNVSNVVSPPEVR